MCGIVGMIGQVNTKEILLKGLEKLEYRGYDSAGLAFVNDGVQVHKEVGRIAALREVVPAEADGTVGIGHTRWATHGVPSVPNAHRTKVRQHVSHSCTTASSKTMSS